ncbi:MAG TPA: SDR family oxidoreductase [Bacteroidota bacterium]|nr:SDR family oxidoreductase [Bacteroidota bacterium]
MKVLFIGGTGNISTSVSRLAVACGIDLYLLNRGKRGTAVPGAKVLIGDISKPDEMRSILTDHAWDSVVDWIAYTVSDIQRDFELFKGKTKQFVFISSASAYQRPAASPFVTESTPLANPFWEYSRNKIACEEKLMSLYRSESFPVTIVRPSLTYDTVIPVPVGGWTEYTTVDRIKKGKKIIVHGDGSSLWTVTHAEDFAKGFVGLLAHQQSIGHAFHITSDEILTWDQIHQAVAEAVGREAHIVHMASDFLASCDEEFRGSLIGDKATSVIFDNSKIKRFVPGFTATIPFRQGIKRTIDWFEADPSRQIIKKETNDMMERMIAQYERAFIS